MRSLLRSILLFIILAGAGVGLSSGCAEAAAAATAIEVTQVTANVVGSIPGWVEEAAIAFQLTKKLDWGKPEKIVVTDTNYVLIYPTSPSQLKANKGVPNMIVIERTDNPQRPL